MKRIFLSLLLTISLWAAKFPAQCIVVIDGDTIYGWVKGFGNTKIRLIGIDAPEKDMGRHALRQSKKWHLLPYMVTSLGWRAKLYLERLLPRGSHFILETDVQLYDDYGRLLGYIWKGNRLINEEMVLRGYAVVYTFPPNVKYVERFTKAQKIAQEKRRGIWAYYPLRYR